SAGRFAEAVPVSMAEADAAAATFAFSEAVDLWERALPHIDDSLVKARVFCRIGEALGMNSESDRAARNLTIAVDQLEAAGGLPTEAAHYRLLLGRALWENGDSDGAMSEYEAAREVLEREPPSADLALAYMRIASHHAFQLDYAVCGEWAQRAVNIAEATGAAKERLWATGFLALSLVVEGRVQDALALFAESIAECIESGNPVVGVNLIYNETWLRAHLTIPMRGSVQRLDLLPQVPATVVARAMLACDEKIAGGDLAAAVESAERGLELATANGFGKMIWRSSVSLAEALYEQGRYADSQAVLPKISTRSETQDVFYDGVVRMRLAIANGETDHALDVARSLAALGDKVSVYRRDLAAAAETLTACGELEEAEALMSVCRGNLANAGLARLDAASARLRLAQGDPQDASRYCESALGELSDSGYVLEDLRARITLAEVQATLGENSLAEMTLGSLLDRANDLGAGAVIDDAIKMAERVGLSMDRPVVADPSDESTESAIPLGERMITSMFADIRSYTPMTVSTPPHDLADKMATLFRWAKDEVERHGGVVDKFAGDAVMATFNVSGASVDHPVQALSAALALREKVRLASIPMGIGIAVGPAIVGNAVTGGHLMVAGVATNLAARLQSAAKAGEIILSDEAYRRLEGQVEAMGLKVHREQLELKGFDEAQTVFRLSNGPAG
ncbi:MAG TPA: adenylate/guanylate cyclase domain-containing protein, partial [Actinomycetota bacterium]|nr:adenylate/guanylate cyclase domain-containing protein [Actinomycetota bacterium]